MTAHLGDGGGHRRVTDAERTEAIARLRAAVGDGVLDLDELGDRVGKAYQARTAGDLARITSDLPVSPPVGAPRRRFTATRNGVFRTHAVAYALTNSFLIGTWAITGADFFWPFFPAAGWGIGLGLHAAAATASEHRRLEKGGAAKHADHPLTSAPTPRAIANEPRQPSATGRVAVLFVDIVESTHLAAALGDAGWSHLRERHRVAVGESLRNHGGREVNVSGDGILACFHDEVSAVRAAVDIHRALRQRRDETGFAPSVRSGVHAGDAVIENNGDVLGVVVNITCRVAGEAEPDEVLVTEAVAERLGDRFTLEGRGLRHIKGLSEPRHLLAIRW